MSEPCPITKRELEVVRALSMGSRTKRAAFDLGLSEHTVHGMLLRARRVTRSKTNAALVATAIRNGWIE